MTKPSNEEAVVQSSAKESGLSEEELRILEGTCVAEQTEQIDVRRKAARLLRAIPPALPVDREVERLTIIVDRINELFSEIRGDWTDPRNECREGWILCEELKKSLDACRSVQPETITSGANSAAIAVLKRVYNAIQLLDDDALGYGHDDHHRWPLRDELIADVEKTLATLRSPPPQASSNEDGVAAQATAGGRLREALAVIRDWRGVLKQLRDEASLSGYNSALESICACADRALASQPGSGGWQPIERLTPDGPRRK